MSYQKRTEGKRNADYGSNDIYKYYCRKTKNPKKLTQTQYFEVFDEFMAHVKHLMMFNSFTFLMPHRLGGIRIFKYKPPLKLDDKGNLSKRNLRPDWKVTINYWKELYPDKTGEELKEIKGKPIIYHLNKHTDGYKTRFGWDKSTAIVKNIRGYSIQPLRCFLREIAKTIKENPKIDFGGLNYTGLDYNTILNKK